MIKVAFCDDDISVLNNISVLLDEYCTESNRSIHYTAYSSPLDLMADIERSIQYDVIFLDVIMPGENGIDAASEIRKYDSNVKIIFLTSSAEFAVQSYTVGAYFYQLKPIYKESFFRLIDSVLYTCEKERSDSLILRCKTGISRVELNNLEYCEVIHHTLFIHLSDGKVLESIGSLDELYRQLSLHECFIRPHRSYIVNLEYIQLISSKHIIMCCGSEIPLPRGKYHEVKDEFLKYSFKKQDIIL